MLNKIALSALAVAALAGAAAAADTTPKLIGEVAALVYKTSNNVKVSYRSDGNDKPQAYAIVSKHTSGDTYYATSNMSTTIYKLQDTTKMGVPLAVGDTQVTGVMSADTLFTGGGAYAPM